MDCWFCSCTSPSSIFITYMSTSNSKIFKKIFQFHLFQIEYKRCLQQSWFIFTWGYYSINTYFFYEAIFCLIWRFTKLFTHQTRKFVVSFFFSYYHLSICSSDAISVLVLLEIDFMSETKSFLDFASSKWILLLPLFAKYYCQGNERFIIIQIKI